MGLTVCPVQSMVGGHLWSGEEGQPALRSPHTHDDQSAGHLVPGMAVWTQANLFPELDTCFVGFATCTVLSDEKACCLSYGTAEHVGRQLGAV